MWQKLKAIFSQIPVIGVTKRNFLMISADIKKGHVIISYKGKVKTGLFTDGTLEKMIKAPDERRYDRHVGEFLIAIAKLINQVR
jgi:hypothetical protein